MRGCLDFPHQNPSHKMWASGSRLCTFTHFSVGIIAHPCLLYINHTGTGPKRPGTQKKHCIPNPCHSSTLSLSSCEKIQPCLLRWYDHPETLGFHHEVPVIKEHSEVLHGLEDSPKPTNFCQERLIHCNWSLQKQEGLPLNKKPWYHYPKELTMCV